MGSTRASNQRDRLMDRGIYKAWTTISVRYNDLDPLGHVNNVGMAIFLEQARCELITPLLKSHGRHLDMVLASTSMDYRTELRYPGSVEVGTITTRIGSKSFDLAHGVYQDGQCAGTAELSLVFFDLDARKTIEPPQEVRKLLQDVQG
ncbi:MAG: acyl-CoA thioesterase [Hyphomicrobiaceae bacterium]